MFGVDGGVNGVIPAEVRGTRLKKIRKKFSLAKNKRKLHPILIRKR